MQKDHCPLADGTHEIWNCPPFRNKSVNGRYAALRKHRLCYGCLGKGHPIKVLYIQCVQHQWMHEEAKPIATL